jgi:PKD repeat protein
MRKYSLLFFVWLVTACSKGSSSDGGTSVNHSPLATLTTKLVSVNPFHYTFTVKATDQDQDALTYNWDFGEGTTRKGTAEESFDFDAEKEYTISVSVSDGKSAPVTLKETIIQKLWR